MTDCLVVGGGIIGLSTARALSIAGFSVVLSEKNKCGMESSWAGAGIISPLYPWKYSDFVNELSLKSQKKYEQFCLDLEKSTNINCEYIKSDLLMLDEFESEKAQKWLKKWQLSYKIQNNKALFSVAQVRNPKILQALKKDLKKRGVKIIENHQTKLTYKNKEAVDEKIPAKNIIICTGSWSADFGADIYPVKGEIITILDNSKAIKNIVLKAGKYIVPRKDGVILVGSTMENVGFNRDLSTAVKDDLFKFASAIFPHLKKCKITNHWCGFRPGSDDDPIIKQSLKYKNLFFNTGHFRNGVNTAIASSEIITNLIQKNAN